ncbi:L-2,4-diaminobutyrate decarboxylase [Tsuneonella dongtanensis]|uniref:L-2,4-diaminobutyrate decarboxylase n=1 Tax=Tsuneonella dongtanensis TaxID=692370 RepID=A0A1B2AEF1_9SPHN|nr:pyridoxal-dependent decarboxylase [Tsuneonella dongtanensis]ANY20532.1 L-2,4-diaminobutyrate decarboxylase [Tsuneonella dongtanensis]
MTIDPLTPLSVAATAAEAYRRRIADAETTPVDDYAACLARFAEPLPERGGEGEAIIRELVAKAEGGIRAMTAPRFFGWVIGSSHPTGVAADWLTSAWGQNCANMKAAPAASAVEAVVAEWILELLGLPCESSVGIVSGATVANTVCLASARGEVLRRAGWDVEADGLFGAPEITVMIGADAHATVFSGLRYLGLGAKRVVTIATDDLGRMLPNALEAALGKAHGPTIVIAQAGQINTGVSDPFDAIAPLCRAAGAWLHVDGAFGLWAAASPKLKHLVAGIEQADSWGTDGHKWLQTPYDGSFAIVRDEAAHRRAMEITASYLPSVGGGERDPSAYVMELSRRARGFAMWAMIKQLGREGVAGMVEADVEVAREMAAEIAAIDGATLVCPAEINQFMVRFGDSDALTLATIEQVQRDAIAFVGPSEWRGQWVMRVSVCSIATTPEDGRITVDAVRAAWEKVRARG